MAAHNYVDHQHDVHDAKHHGAYDNNRADNNRADNNVVITGADHHETTDHDRTTAGTNASVTTYLTANVLAVRNLRKVQSHTPLPDRQRRHGQSRAHLPKLGQPS
jgi:hypothetical protein